MAFIEVMYGKPYLCSLHRKVSLSSYEKHSESHTFNRFLSMIVEILKNQRKRKKTGKYDDKKCSEKKINVLKIA